MTGSSSGLKRPGDAVEVNFDLYGANGSSADADLLPTCVLQRAGNPPEDVAATVSKGSLPTGRYFASAAIPSNWEAGDQWSLVVDATVEGVQATGIIQSGFLGPTAAQEMATLRDALKTVSVEVVSPLSQNGKRLWLTHGDDYAAANSRSLRFEIENAPELVGSKAVLRLNGLTLDACESPEITDASQVVVMGDLLAAVTSQLLVSDTLQPYQIRFVKGSLVASVIKGMMTVEAQV